jgi:hypothetical protein
LCFSAATRFLFLETRCDRFSVLGIIVRFFPLRSPEIIFFSLVFLCYRWYISCLSVAVKDGILVFLSWIFQLQKNSQQRSGSPPFDRRCLLIFSADADLANSLTLLLEDRYEVVKVTQLEHLDQSLKESSPALLLVDLFSTPQDALKQLLYLEQLKSTVPLILLRAYRSNTPIDDAIKRLNAYVFYKPVNIDMVVDLVQELTSFHVSE